MLFSDSAGSYWLVAVQSCGTLPLASEAGFEATRPAPGLEVFE